MLDHGGNKFVSKRDQSSGISVPISIVLVVIAVELKPAERDGDT